MGTLREVKRKLKHDKNFRKTLVRSAKDEILIDVDGDGVPDVALMDSTGDGNIDTLAMDLSGDGEFDFYFHDNDGDGLPDMVYLSEDGDEALETAFIEEEIKSRMIGSADAILTAMGAGEYLAEALDRELDNMQEMLLLTKEMLEKA
ncbi:MAG: hypothetical protein LUD12_01575 [Lachnospiraceae bacterium]|nr:hypothetical protein [Lachnospiraceae bacterium]